MDQETGRKLMVLIQSNEPENSKSEASDPSLYTENEERENTIQYSSTKSTPPSPDSEPQSQSLFCTMSNFHSSVIYLSQELQNLGLQYKLIEAHGEKLNLIALVNSCWNVIQLYHNVIKDSNTLHDSRRRDVADINHLQGSVRDLKCVVEEKDRLLQEAQEKERQANSINKALATKFKSEKEEVRRLNSVLQQREAQHQHEIRKKEMEMNKLQDRLHRFISGERGTEARMSTLTMSGSLTRSDRTRGRWRTDNTSIKQEEELYRRVLGQYESWVGQLTEEGDLLKEFLASVSAKISRMAVKCAHLQMSSVLNERDLASESLACSALSCDGLDDDPVDALNFVFVRERIRKSLEDNLQLINEALTSKSRGSTNEVGKMEVPKQPNKGHDDDRDENDDDEDVCENSEADEVVDVSLEKQLNLLFENVCVEKEAELREEMKKVMEVTKKLQEERETFAAAAVRLNKERAAFELEKVELLRHQFLEELPSSTLSESRDPFTPNTSMESHLNQSFNDLYGDSPRNISAIPVLVSPTGTITHTSHPVVLGPTRIPRHHRGSNPGTPTAGGGKSEPPTRNSSSGRSSEMRFYQEMARAKTLERPPSHSSPKVGDVVSGSLSYLMTRPGVRSHPLSLFPSVSNMAQSVNCPLLPTDEKRRSRQDCLSRQSTAGELPLSVPRRPSSRASGKKAVVCCDECLNLDSGLYCDCDALSSASTETNNRLNALETSLTSLLRQIDKGEQKNSSNSVVTSPSRVGRGADRPTVPQKVTPRQSTPTSRKSSFPLLPSKGSSGAAPFVGAQHTSSLKRNYSDRKHVRLSSAPGNLAANKKTSQDSSGDDYFSKIQNNIAKWYWK